MSTVIERDAGVTGTEPVPVKRDKSGFRLRGLNMTRIETFTDAAFAFALTLLVISVRPPADIGELRGVLLNIPSFVLSATLLMTFWWGHHEWSRRYGLDDGPTLVLSCVLVFTVLVYVYPLRFMTSMFVTWIRMLMGYRPDVILGRPEDVNEMFLIYGCGFVAMSVAIALLNVHAWRQRDALQLDAVERHGTRTAIGTWLILATSGVISILLAASAPPSWIGLPGWAYAPLGIIMPWYGRAMEKRALRG